MRKIKYAGFTLAEVLITLGIIGVVAALTLPTLISKYQKQVLVNQLKKNYVNLNEGIKRLVTNEGCTTLVCAGFSIDGTNLKFTNETQQKFIQTFKLENVIISPTTNAGIYNYFVKGLKSSDGYNFSYFLRDGSDYWGNSLVGTTPDGAMIIFNAYDGEANILIDVNGTKGPNMFGRDVFGLWLFDYKDTATVTATYSKIYQGEESATGSENLANQYCLSDWPGTNMLGCAEKIISENWEMNY